MAVTQSDIDTLNSAIASGTRSVTLGNQTVTYGTVDALIKARDDLERQLRKQAGTKPTKRTHLYYAGRGY